MVGCVLWVCFCLVANWCLILLWPRGLLFARLLCQWDFSGKSTGVGCHSLLEGIFLTQELNLCLLNWRWILYHCATWDALLVQDWIPIPQEGIPSPTGLDHINSSIFFHQLPNIILLVKSLNDLLNTFLVKWSKTCHFKMSLALEMVVFYSRHIFLCLFKLNLDNNTCS